MMGSNDPSLNNNVEESDSKSSSRRQRSLSFGKDLERIIVYDHHAPPSDMLFSPTFYVTDNPKDSRAAFGKASWSIANLVHFNNPLEALLNSIHQPVMLENVVLENDRILQGCILVKNIAYEKWIVARYSNNGWKSWQEVAATYMDSVSVLVDRFCFRIDLEEELGEDEEGAAIAAWREFRSGKERSALKRRQNSQTSPPSVLSDIDFDDGSDSEAESSNAIDELYSRPDKTIHTLSFCIRFEANGMTYWDSNKDHNYNYELRRVSGRNKTEIAPKAKTWDLATTPIIDRNVTKAAENQQTRHHRRAAATVIAFGGEFNGENNAKDEVNHSRSKEVESVTPTMSSISNTTSASSISNLAPKPFPFMATQFFWVGVDQTIAIVIPRASSASSVATSFKAALAKPDMVSKLKIKNEVADRINIPFSSSATLDNAMHSSFASSRLYLSILLYSRSPLDSLGSFLFNGLAYANNAAHPLLHTDTPMSRMPLPPPKTSNNETVTLSVHSAVSDAVAIKVPGVFGTSPPALVVG